MTWVAVVAPGVTGVPTGIVDSPHVGEMHTAGDDAELAAIATRAVDRGAGQIAVAGTDADLATVAGGALASGSRVAIALLPTGPSALLRMFGLGTGVQRLGHGTRYPTDLGQVSSGSRRRYFVTAVAASRWSERWWWRRPDSVRIETARRTTDTRSSLIVAANAQHLGERTISPRAAVTDGMLDLQSFSGSLLQRRRAWEAAKRGLHLPWVWRRSVAAARLDVPAAWTLRADGRTVGSGSFSVETVPVAFDLWI